MVKFYVRSIVQKRFIAVNIIQRQKFYTIAGFPSSSSSSYFIFQHNKKQIKIITVEYKNMPEGCQRSKRSLNWPPFTLNVHTQFCMGKYGNVA